MTDCLIVGNNDSNFAEYLEMVRSMGTESGAYQDLFLAFMNYQDHPYRALDIMTRFHYEGREHKDYRPFHNMDFLWATVSYLGSYIAKRGYSFDYINAFQLEKEKFREKLLSDDLLSIAVTTTLYVVPQPVLEVVEFVRKYNKKVKIIIGGPHVQNQVKLAQDDDTVQRFFKYINADYYVISSEGEATLVKLLDMLKNGGDPSTINNLAYRQGDNYVITPTEVESNSITDEWVDYSLFKDDLGEMVSLRTAKSCPFACAFCGFPQRAGKYTYMSVEDYERELDRLAEIPSVNTLTILDDTFNVPKGRYKELMRLMIRKNYGFHWWANYRSDQGDEETIELMAEAGCEGVFLGIESGSDVMLKHMNKTAKRKHYMNAIPLLRKAGIWSHASIIVGFPGETKDTVAESVSLVEEAQPDSFRTLLWYADPVTPIWQRREEFGIKGEAFNWSHNTMNYQEACDIIDRCFLSMRNSVWLPQYGFEQWSIFYLMRRGMSKPQIKEFLHAFNRVIREELMFPEKKEATPVLVEHLRQISQYDVEHPNRVDGSHLYRPEDYLAAEAFWLSEFDRPVEQNLDDYLDHAPRLATHQPEMASMPLAVDAAVLDRLQSAGQEPISLTLLGAFSALLSRLNGREDTALVATIDREGAPQWSAPFRISPLWDLSFSDLVTQVANKVEQVFQHRLHGFHFVTNPIRMGERGCPTFDAAFRFVDLNKTGERDDLEDILKYYPEVTNAIALELVVSDNAGQLQLELRYPSDRFAQDALDSLAALFVSALEEISQDPELRIDAIRLGQEETEQAPELQAAAGFNF